MARIGQELYDKDIFLGLLAFDEKNNEASMSNIVHLHLTSNGDILSDTKNLAPYNKPVKSVIDSAQSIIIGSICGALLIVGLIMWLGIWYIKNQRGSFKSSKQNTIEVNLVNETTSDSSPPSTIQRESSNLMKNGIQNQAPNTPIYWSASQLLDNNNLMNRGVNATLDPISEEISSNDDEEIYAQGLANYGRQTQQQLRQLHQTLHEPIYVGYSPENNTASSIYGTTGKKKIPPKVPPKPSINALLGIGIVIPPNQEDTYGTSKATRHISHV